jgi:ABC transporter, phosphonate, periplasmic substrate-binding protein
VPTRERSLRRAPVAGTLALVLLGLLFSARISLAAQSMRKVALALTPSRDPTVLHDVGAELATYLSRHLSMVLLVKEGLVQDRDPKTFFKESIFAGGHDAALLSVLNGSVDAAAAFDEAPERILKDPHKAARFRHIAETSRIPNDGAALRRGLGPELKAHLTSSLLALNTPEGIDLLRRLYNIDGLVPAQDGDYDPVREAVDLLGAR